LLLLLCAAARFMVCARTEVPGRDGVAYLWMAEQAAAGDPAALFATVFHPLYPALVAGLLSCVPGFDAVAAGQLVAAGTGALAVLPLWALTRTLFGSSAATWAGVAYALGTWFCRHPAECMSEGPFYLAVATWGQALLRERPRPGLAGFAAAAAYLLRPEGAALFLCGGLWLLHRRDRRAVWSFAAAALPFAAILPAGYAAWGSGFTLTPKAGFNYEAGVGGAAAPLRHYLQELAKVPGSLFENLGFLWFPLGMFGSWLWRRRQGSDAGLLLLAPLVLQCAVIPLLRSHYRFVSGFGVLILPFAAFGLLRLLEHARRAGPLLPALLVAVVLGSEGRIVAARNRDRAIERELGRWCGARLEPGETVASDMPRFCYFAGQRPPPPRPILAEDLLVQASEPACRFVALVRDRTPGVKPEFLGKLGLEEMELPVLLCGPADQRILLFVRTSHR
jgi:hypothetical protein